MRIRRSGGRRRTPAGYGSECGFGQSRRRPADAAEVITRLRDLQAQLRAAQLKQRDLGAERLILVVAGSHANRVALTAARPTLLATFELDTRRVLANLAAGHDPGRDAVIVLR